MARFPLFSFSRAVRGTALLPLCFLLAPAVLRAEDSPKGQLLLIGGGKRPRAIMEKFIALSGGPSASILIVPTASEEKDTVERYKKEFMALGATNVAGLDLKGPLDAQRKALVEDVEGAGGIFFAGGDQRKIVTALRGSPLLKAIEAAYRRGAVIGGTSAGLACMSPVMLTGEGDFSRITTKNVEVWPGLGLFPGVILDQHFVARGRQTRLMTALLEHPGYLGLGVDEATAVWLKPDQTLEVLGEGWVIVYDAASATITKGKGDGSVPLGVRNLRTHVLLAGDGFDLTIRSVLEKSPVSLPQTPAAEPVPVSTVITPLGKGQAETPLTSWPSGSPLSSEARCNAPCVSWRLPPFS